MIRFTERKSSGATYPVLVAPDDVSVVGTDDTSPGLTTIIWIKSTGKFVWVTESVSEVEEKLNAAPKTQSG